MPLTCLLAAEVGVVSEGLTSSWPQCQITQSQGDSILRLWLFGKKRSLFPLVVVRLGARDSGAPGGKSWHENEACAEEGRDGDHFPVLCFAPRPLSGPVAPLVFPVYLRSTSFLWEEDGNDNF